MTVQENTTYTVAGVSIASSMPFPELPIAADPAAEIRFHCAAALESLQPGTALFSSYHVPERPEEFYQQWQGPRYNVYASAAKQDGAYLICFGDDAVFVIEAEGREITCLPRAGYPEHCVAHLFLDHVLPRVLAHRGALVLHAGAFADSQGALLLVGTSGSGKSTLLTYAVHQGSIFLSDDFALVEPAATGFRCIGSYPGTRLWSDARAHLLPKQQGEGVPVSADGRKRRYILPANSSEAIPGQSTVHAVVLLAGSEDPTEPEVELLSPQEGFAAVLSHSFVLDTADTVVAAAHFRRVTAFLADTSVYRLRYQQEFSELKRVLAVLLEL